VVLGSVSIDWEVALMIEAPRCFEWAAEETVVNKAPLAKMETQDEER